jgi:hypothetical protein
LSVFEPVAEEEQTISHIAGTIREGLGSGIDNNPEPFNVDLIVAEDDSPAQVQEADKEEQRRANADEKMQIQAASFSYKQVGRIQFRRSNA